MRFLLYKEWANVKKCLHYQPLDYVKEYFGVKIGLYFAWLGFYTYMLIPASIVGVLCFLYGCLTLNSNEPSEDICSRNLTIKMCPLCDHYCRYWDLSETCFHARVTYLFDNPATVFFAVFMSLWGLCFLFENYFHFFSLLFLYGINYYPFYSIFRSDSIFGIMEKIFGGNNSSMGFDEFGCS